MGIPLYRGKIPGWRGGCASRIINNKASHAGHFNLAMGEIWRVIRLHTIGSVERFLGITGQIEYGIFYQ